MELPKTVQLFYQQIAREFQPERIVLFGSYANGIPNQYSDVDLLVIMPFEGSPLQQAARIISRLNPQLSVDLIVRTPEQVRDRLAMKDSFIEEIMERGKTVYEASVQSSNFSLSNAALRWRWHAEA